MCQVNMLFPHSCYILNIDSMKKFGKELSIKIEEEYVESQGSSFQRESNVVPQRSMGSEYEQQNSIKNESNDHPTNVVEFQQFLVQDERQSYKNSTDISNKPSHDLFIADFKPNYRNNLKKTFVIDIPEPKSHLNKANLNDSVTQKEDYLEPPAPSHKKSYKGSKNFMFPVIHEQKEPQIASSTAKINESNKIQEITKSFDRERQQFYRQKSKYEKQLLVKEGQIELLQNMLTGRRIGEGQWMAQNHHQQLQSILLQKDMQINELVQKIAQITKQLGNQNQQVRSHKTQIMKLEHINESLAHQLYMIQNKQINMKTTQQFYDIKRKKPMTPTSGWNYEDNKRESLKFSGFQNLHKRLQSLRQNRQQIQDRNKIKSEMSFTENKYKTSNYEPKGYLNYSNFKY